jgi:serine/threonine protein kinase
VLHRDIKPENVLVSAYEEPKLADFGIARLEGGLRSRTSALIATPAYAAPEILDGQQASAASDVYSLAATLFALIVGQPPFARDGDESHFALIARAATEPVPDLRRRGVPGPVCNVLEAGLEKDPARRVGVALEYGRRLQDAQRAVGCVATRIIGADLANADGRRSAETVVVAPPDDVAAGFWFYVDDPEPLVSPHDHSRTVGELQPGQWYVAGEQSGDWVYVADEHGTEGWIPTSAVRRYDP